MPGKVIFQETPEGAAVQEALYFIKDGRPCVIIFPASQKFDENDKVVKEDDRLFVYLGLSEDDAVREVADLHESLAIFGIERTEE